MSNRRLVYIQPPVRESCAPKRSYHRPTVSLDDATVYRKSFYEFDTATMTKCRPPMAVPPNSLNTDRSVEVASDTTHSLSYIEHDEYRPGELIRPRSRLCVGKGPIQDVTTNRHDFVPKIVPKQPIHEPNDHFVASDVPLSSNTTTKLSYPGQFNVPLTEICKPSQELQPSDSPIQKDTIQKLSYGPIEVSLPEVPPWAIQPPFRRPSIPMAHLTTQNLSFQPPGEFVEVGDSHPDHDVRLEKDPYPKAGL